MNSAKGKFSAKYRTALLSTGVASLDVLLNGGLASKSITLIEEDKLNIHCSLLGQHFVACGLSNSQDTALIIDESSPELYLENLPKIVSGSTNALTDKMKIAWRYNVKPSIGADLYNTENDAAVGVVDKSKLSSHFIDKESLSENLQTVFNFISKFVKEKSGMRKPLRILISSLGSPLWGTYDNKTTFFDQIYRFLFYLKSVINDDSVVVVTIKPEIFENDGFNTSVALRSLSNYVFKFEAFEDPKSVGDQLYNDVTGQIRQLKIPTINSIEPIFKPNTLIWSYHVRRKKMIFKEFSLPPCLGDTTSRSSQNEPSKKINMLGGCGIDF